MRGKAVAVSDDWADVRITPAYAGKRIPFWMTALMLRDHPRICGEKREQAKKEWQEGGSPPHMRGKVI